mmetsp:Transcript_49716/g.92016  ORF Transcript_49716/g.92016 Transcript_49716/m.92016 type:complete len:87 (-) Transcript_49716:405-665(-)
MIEPQGTDMQEERRYCLENKTLLFRIAPSALLQLLFMHGKYTVFFLSQQCALFFFSAVVVTHFMPGGFHRAFKRRREVELTRVEKQ